MAVYWFKKDAGNRIKFFRCEMKKLILKSLLFDDRFFFNQKIYFRRIFDLFDRTQSVSFYKRSCLFTGHSRAVFRKFKLCRQMSKFYASNGFIIGLKKCSF